MRLYSGKVKVIASEIARELINSEAIEVEKQNEHEVVLDIESILKEYLRTDREISSEARDIMEARRLNYSKFGRIKRDIAKKRNFGLGEDALDWITDQLIELLLHTAHVEEVWAEDKKLRLAMRPILIKHMSVDDDLDAEVRKRIKNLNEGSDAWDIKYEQVMKQMKDRRGLE